MLRSAALLHCLQQSGAGAGLLGSAGSGSTAQALLAPGVLTQTLQRCFASATTPRKKKEPAAASSPKAAAKAPKAPKAAASPKAAAGEKKPKTPKPASKQRVLSAYTLFVKDRAASLSGVAGKDMLTRVAQEWRGMTEQQKAPYQSEAAASKATILQAREAAKKPPTAYAAFLKEQYAQGAGAGLKITEAAKQIGARWRALPEAERQQRKAAAEAAAAAWKAAQSQG